jgi:hypothetical protein
MRVVDGEIPWVPNAMHARSDIPPEMFELEQQRQADPIAMVLAARIEEVRLAGKDGRRRDAAIGWVTVAELFPLLWVSRRLATGAQPADVNAVSRHLRHLAGASCSRSKRNVSLPDDERADAPLLARAAADCVAQTCATCPLQGDHALINDRDGAKLALALRHSREAAHMVRLRNRWVHGLYPESAGGEEPEITKAVAKAYKAIPGYGGGDGVAEGLRFVFTKLYGANPPAVLSAIARVIANALGQSDR